MAQAESPPSLPSSAPAYCCRAVGLPEPWHLLQWHFLVLVTGRKSSYLCSTQGYGQLAWGLWLAQASP